MATSTLRRSPKEIDPAVVSLLHDQEVGGGQVVETIARILEIMDALDSPDYGSQMRILTKTLMILNERHRQATWTTKNS